MKQPDQPNQSIFPQKHHEGRMILFVFIVFAFLSAAFVELSEDVISKETLLWDQGVLLYINAHSNPVFDRIIPLLTNLGGALGVTLITLACLLLYYRRKDFSRFSLLFFTVAGATALNLILKLVFKRQRPALWDLLVFEPTFSFPSGHAMASSALAFALIIALKNEPYQVPLRVLAMAYILFIGFTRLYLGVHYPTDILAGWLVSLAWSLIVMLILNNRLKEDYII